MIKALRKNAMPFLDNLSQIWYTIVDNFSRFYSIQKGMSAWIRINILLVSV